MGNGGEQSQDAGGGGRPARRHRRLTVMVWAVASACLLLAIILTGPCEESTFFDLAAGRQRHEVRLLGVRVSQSLQDSALTRVYRRLVGAPPEPEWRFCYAYRRSGCNTMIADGSYGGANYYATWLGSALASGPLTDEARRAVVLGFLDLVKHNPRAAEDYADRVEQLIEVDHPRDKGPVGVADLPDPEKFRRKYPQW